MGAPGEGESSASEADVDLELLKARKLRDLQRKLMAPKEETPRDVVAGRLIDRGLEVLELAERYYPEQAARIVKMLAELVKKYELKGYIRGGELLWFFRRLGLDIRPETTIKVEQDGRLVSLADRLKGERD